LSACIASKRPSVHTLVPPSPKERKGGKEEGRMEGGREGERESNQPQIVDEMQGKRNPYILLVRM
jgi:hypothetical protein